MVSPEPDAMRENLTRIRFDQAGFALVEIMVSAMLLVIVAVGVFTAFDASTRATAEERHRARAHDLAEADVERMRSMRVADLASLNQTKVVTQDGLNYTLHSQSQFVTETAGTSTCSPGSGSNDYLKVSSTVTWASIGSRPPVVINGVVSPPNGSIVPNSGSLIVSVQESRGAPVAGVSLSGSGPGSFNGTTGPTGCVLWRNLPAGDYSMSVAGVASGKVDKDGNPPQAQTVSVVAESTNTVALLYDDPGSIQGITFRTVDYTNTLVNSTGDMVVIANTGMTTSRAFGTAGSKVTSLSTPNTIFPFTSPYAVYPGSCGTNDPGAGPGMGSVTVPIGGAATGPVLQLPALHLSVWDGTSLGNSSPVPNAQVKVRDVGCGNLLRTFTTDSQGHLPDPGLPYGTYQVCVSGIDSSGNLRNSTTGMPGNPNNPDVTSFAGGTVLDGFLRGGGTSAGACP